MRKTSFLPDVPGVWRFIKDPNTDWKPKLLALVAIAYLFWPLDLAPDVVPIVGWLDDLGFIAVATGYLLHVSRANTKE